VNAPLKGTPMSVRAQWGTSSVRYKTDHVSQRLGVKIPRVNKLGIGCEIIITTGEYSAPSNTTNYPPIPDIFALIKETGGRLGSFPL